MAVLYSRLVSVNDKEREEAKSIVATAAEKWGNRKFEEVLNLIRTLYEDDQVQLVWRLFGGSFDRPVHEQFVTAQDAAFVSNGLAAAAV